MNMKLLMLTAALLALFAANGVAAISTNDWQLGPLTRADWANPVLKPDATSQFYCPLRREVLPWESWAVFNPGAVTHDGKIFMLYRAEDGTGITKGGTSRLGLAVSHDGFSFKRNSAPVLYPDEDSMKSLEWPGGCEDARLVEAPDGRFILTYTSWNRDRAHLCVASTKNFLNWTKHGTAFRNSGYDFSGTKWYKSGSIVCERQGDRLVAAKLRGKFWMFWGVGGIYLASSDNLTDWKPVTGADGKLLVVLGPGATSYEKTAVECGPPALVTDKGVLLIYNAIEHVPANVTRNNPVGETYRAMQVLFDKDDLRKVIARADAPFLAPEKPFELAGQTEFVTFSTGLVHFRGQWFLYYAAGDSCIAVMTCPDKAGF